MQKNQHQYPTWGSLARDYLSVMASSVSSERAFSSAGITISKRRNRLKGDLVEALQCLKCLFKNELIFREVCPLRDELQELEDNTDMVDDDGDVGKVLEERTKLFVSSVELVVSECHSVKSELIECFCDLLTPVERVK